ncbi:metallophosphoesterase family protein [Frankia sp. Cas3]|uniref:metallophosphoesterase family protein n=1 Tax=Frankia sp. Cas3 TaxID=3073926 RepID=UPI002AD41BCC|nr:metallophosphoesterase family protein [Frankia sp. Cas3]
MSEEPSVARSQPALGRRALLRAAGVAGLTAAAVPLLERPGVAAELVRQPTVAGAPSPEQLHVQFGTDAASQITVSWATPERVSQPRLRLGRHGSGFGTSVDAQERVYVEALTGQTVWTYHAELDRLASDTDFTYAVHHRGAPPVEGTFRTAPRGRKRFRFTSFGDQAVPAAVGQGLGPWSANSGYIVDAVEALDPLFHLVNGDLCYANVSDDPVGTWRSFFNNNMRSARNRPWMPCAGNHENEVGNGPQGYLAYQTRFALPCNDSKVPDFAGNWYAFTVGSVRVISINNDDVCLQDGGFSGYRRDHVPTYASAGSNPYIHGYSQGEQRAWLERTLAAARHDRDIDWIVVFMHQVAMSSAHFNGADLGIRQEFVPLFDKYGVDLVLGGHEHHFERTFPVRGILPGSSLLTPAPQADDATVIDTTRGTVHMIIGGGGHPAFTPPAAFDAPHDGVVIYDVAAGSPTTQHRALTTTEPAPWSAYRDLATPYGFASFDVEPNAPGGKTTITVSHFGAAAGSSSYTELDRFTLVRPRNHRHGMDG